MGEKPREVRAKAMPRKSQFNTLNDKQIHLLKLTYKFRFVTAPLLARYKDLKSRSSMYTTLERLAEQEYLGKYKTKNEGFQNKGTRYYLTTKGLSYLSSNHGIGAHMAKAIGGNRNVTERFKDQHIADLRLYLLIDDTYPGQFEIYTRTEIAGQKHFPTPLPDLYLMRSKPVDDKLNEFFLFDITYKPFYEFKKDFPKLIEHLDTEVWENKTGRPYPGVLLVCADSRQEFAVQKYVSVTLENTGIEELKVQTFSSLTNLTNVKYL